MDHQNTKIKIFKKKLTNEETKTIVKSRSPL